MAQNEEEVTQAVSRWTGAMPSPPPRRPEAEDRPAMMAPPAAPRPEPQTPQTQSLSLRAAAPAPMPPRVAAPAPVAPRPSEDAASVDVPAPAIGRGSRRAGRVKTRLLGFNGGQARVDPFAAAAPVAAEAPEDDNEAAPVMFPVGWLVVVAGPGTGASFPLPAGVAQIGRGVGQAVRLDLGDNSISRENHAAVAYDAEERKFYLGHGGKANLVRRNNRPVLSTEELSSGDTVRIGETTLRFVALCGSDFDWAQG